MFQWFWSDGWIKDWCVCHFFACKCVLNKWEQQQYHIYWLMRSRFDCTFITKPKTLNLMRGTWCHPNEILINISVTLRRFSCPSPLWHFLSILFVFVCFYWKGSLQLYWKAILYEIQMYSVWEHCVIWLSTLFIDNLSLFERLSVCACLRLGAFYSRVLSYPVMFMHFHFWNLKLMFLLTVGFPLSISLGKYI